MKEYIKKKVSEYDKNDGFSKSEWIQYTDSIANNLGWFIITFNMLEDSIIELLVDLFVLKFKIQEESIYAFLSEMSYSQKIRALDAQVKIYSEKCKNRDEILDCLQKIVKELEELGTIRNNYAHANWYDSEGIGEKRIIRIKIKTEKKGIFNYYLEINPSEIELNEDRIEKADDMLGELEKKMGIL